MSLRLIPGRPLIGFWGMFEECYGDASTESGMPTITPSFIGSSMLPFRCPRCKVVAQELACPITRDHYKDPRKDNHFCPNCGQRFRLDMNGTPLAHSIPAGAVVGPSKVERSGEVTWQDTKTSTMLGGTTMRSGYEILGESEPSVTVFGAGFWRALFTSRFNASNETITNPTKVIVSPPKGASSVFAMPRSVAVSGWSKRSVPPRSWSADTIYFEKPVKVTVTLANGTVQVLNNMGFVDVRGGVSSKG